MRTALTSQWLTQLLQRHQQALCRLKEQNEMGVTHQPAHGQVGDSGQRSIG